VVENLNKVARKVNQIGEKVYSATGGSEKGGGAPASQKSPVKEGAAEA
jgi:hypothetical protein